MEQWRKQPLYNLPSLKMLLRHRPPKSGKAVLLFVGLIAVFAATYGLAWWNAYRLTSDYLDDADASFGAGNLP